MARKEAKVKYDEENDILYVYSGNNVKDSIGIDNFIFDMSVDGRIINVEILNAFKVLKDFSNLEISKKDVSNIKNASIATIQSRELVFAKIVLCFEIKNKLVEAILQAPMPKIAITA